MIGLAAVSKNWVIGDENTGKIPWKNKNDLQFFRSITWHKDIIVGRKTYDNLPFLENRYIHVLTRDLNLIDKKFNGGEYFCFAKFLDPIDFLKYCKDFIVCGGRDTYRQLLKLCSELYLTIFDFEIKNLDNPVFFPYSLFEIENLFPNKQKVKNIKDGIIYKYSE